MRKKNPPKRVAIDPESVKGKIPTGVASINGDTLTKFSNAVRMLPLGKERALSAGNLVPVPDTNLRQVKRARNRKQHDSLW